MTDLNKWPAVNFPRSLLVVTKFTTDYFMLQKGAERNEDMKSGTARIAQQFWRRHCYSIPE